MQRELTAFEGSILHERVDRAINQGHPNDYVICVTASSKTSVSGTGKTTLEARLGKGFDQSRGGFDAKEKATLDAGDLAYNIVPDTESLSAIIGDEMQGAPGTVGLDKRRGMKQEVVDAISSILANRDKQFVIIIGAQMVQMLDIRFVPIIDSWLLIRHGPDHPEGPLGTHHLVYVDDYNFRDPKIRTPALEDFTWDSLPYDDPDYAHLEKMKQKAKRKRQDDEEDRDLPKQTQARIAQQYREMGYSARWIADNVEEITYGYSWIYEHTDNPDNTASEETA